MKLKIGPGAMVAAAFIGPGTVTACTVAGAEFGYALLWALLFAVLATMALQEMAARLGTVAGAGLGEALRRELRGNRLRWPLFALIGTALYAGNSAYEGGNLSGAALGIEALGGGEGSFRVAVMTIAGAAALLLALGSYRLLERALIALVLLMAAAFLAAGIVVGVDMRALVTGLFVPSAPGGSALTVVALVGTTVVPYNLFLHAAAAKARWHPSGDVAAARGDTVLSVGLGGLISILIVATAAASLFAEGMRVEGAADMAAQLAPLFGDFAPILLGTGLFAAGLTSSITAPLATGYAVAEVLGWPSDAKDRGVRLVAISVVGFGTLVALTGVRPVEIIITAQVANGLLLPIMAAFLLFAMNRHGLLGSAANDWWANALGLLVLIVSTGLGARAVLAATGILG
ncbi:Nramp family divalent metal transporter [Pacificimonas flava]|nr:Nramp family divalent metal transporter [Pacificimonas flava]MBB5280220.1 Mn2+/Fe2+ NRAMP family transporter [Pacificimonas flava]